ncbi:hypothetical protein ACH0B5_03600 [Ureibacillus sp. 179-F W5.1 NHS]
MLAISNPQYAFLEADYMNPNLNRFLPKLKDCSEKVDDREQHEDLSETLLKMIPTNVYLKVNWLSYFVNSRYLFYCNSVDRRGIFILKTLNLIP